MPHSKDTKAYLVGGGIASLAAAAYILRDSKVPGSNIHIFEEQTILGGSLDGRGDPQKGYIMRGGRMFNFSYGCTYDLLSFIPSLNKPGKMVSREIEEFNEKVKTHSNCRMVDINHKKIDVSSMGFDFKDRAQFLEMLARSEDHFGHDRIQDQFQPSFFTSNFWYMWATMFGFQPWHSAVEFKRYLHRFIHEFSRINTLEGVDRTPLNQYDSVVRPLEKWLTEQGVQFHLSSQVTDLGFSTRTEAGKKTQRVDKIYVTQNNQAKEIPVDENDRVIVTIGSMTESSSYGSMKSAPQLKDKKAGGSWMLWEKIAEHSPDFGNPKAFNGRIDESKWLSFTVTQQDSYFFKLIEEFTNNTPGTGALMTFRDSNWLMSIVIAYQPHFPNQPDNVKVFWGYGLFVDKKGNYINKPMSECTGEEILTELCMHLGFEKDLSKIIQSSNCIPCMMPFITSQFLTRDKTDRPSVTPASCNNLAFVGQFCEVPEDVVFTVEYSVRTAQLAVFKLFDIPKYPPSVYKGEHNVLVMIDAIKTMFASGNSSAGEELPPFQI